MWYNELGFPMFEDGEEIYDNRGNLITVKRTEQDSDGFYRAIYDLNGIEVWCFSIDCRTLQQGPLPEYPNGPAVPPPAPPIRTYADGEKILDNKGVEITVKRTEFDTDGFPRVYFDRDGVELWCFSVDCTVIPGTNPAPGPVKPYVPPVVPGSPVYEPTPTNPTPEPEPEPEVDPEPEPEPEVDPEPEPEVEQDPETLDK